MSCGTPIPYPLAGKLCGRLIDVRIPLCATPCQRGVDQDAPSGVDGQNSVTSMKDACRRAGGDVERMVWTEALILQYSQRQFRVSISSFNGNIGSCSCFNCMHVLGVITPVLMYSYPTVSFRFLSWSYGALMWEYRQ